MKYSELEVRRLLRDSGSKSGSSGHELHLSRIRASVFLSFRNITIDACAIAIILENRSDGVVGCQPRDIHHRRFYEFLVNPGTIIVLGDVAFRFRELCQERRLKFQIAE